MTDYTKTKIYKIESHMGDKIYVGSTAKFYLSQRLQQHKNSYKQWKEGKVNRVTSYELFDEYGVDNCFIVLIEDYSCTTKDQKNAREGHYIKELNCVNKCVIGRTTAETMRAYNQSEKGKDVMKKYQQSDKGKNAAKKYQQSDEGKEKHSNYVKEYQQSDEGKEAQKKASKNYYQKKKALKLELEKQPELSEPIIN